MPLDHKQEFERLKETFRRKKQERQNVYIATAVDVTPLAAYGYLIAQLKDGTTVNVQSWVNVAIAAGHQIMIMPVSDQPWAGYVLVGANASTDVTTTPYVTPSPGSGGSGSVDWSSVDTSTTKIDLTSQVTGNLPVANQARQITKQSWTTTTSLISPGASVTGVFSGANAVLVRSVSLSGGTNALLQLLEQPAGTIEYETAMIATPFFDQGPWVHYDAAMSQSFAYQLTNNGAASASFTLVITGLAFAI